MICPNCKAEITDNSKFCNKCGVSLLDRTAKLKAKEITFKQNELKFPALKKLKSLTKKQIMVIIVFVILILGIGIGGYSFYKNTPEQRAIVFAKQQANNMGDTIKDTLLLVPDKVISIENQSNNVYKITFNGTYITWPDSHPEDDYPETHKYNVNYIITVKLNSDNQFSLVEESMVKVNQIY